MEILLQTQCAGVRVNSKNPEISYGQFDVMGGTFNVQVDAVASEALKKTNHRMLNARFSLKTQQATLFNRDQTVLVVESLISFELVK